MPRVLRDILWVIVPTLIVSAIFLIFNLDETIAKAMYDPQNHAAWFIRQYSNTPGALITVFFLIFILSPWVNKIALLRRTALLWLFTVILGGGLFTHVVLKESVERPRPRDGVLLEYQAEQLGDPSIAEKAKLSGKSFPSGHTAMAAAFIIPFFTLRRRHKKAALAVAAFAVVYTAGVSWARMTLGAHFFLDCLWGFSIVTIFAALGRTFITEATRLKRRYIAAFLVFTVFCIAWFNSFKLTLNYTTENAELIEEIDLPCAYDNISTHAGEELTLSVELKGYGAPLSWLALKEKEGRLFLVRHFGVYHGLSCQIKSLNMPASMVNELIFNQ